MDGGLYDPAPSWRERLRAGWARLTAGRRRGRVQAVPLDRYRTAGPRFDAPAGRRGRRQPVGAPAPRAISLAVVVAVLVLVVFGWLFVQSILQPRSAGAPAQPATVPTAVIPSVQAALAAAQTPIAVLPTAAPSGSVPASPSPVAGAGVPVASPGPAEPRDGPPGAAPPTPPTAPRRIHEVKAGETLGQIAQMYGTTVAAIARENGIQDPAKLSIGQKLRIP